jgi:hypothetical protein
MSILDPVQKTLAPGIWNSENEMYPDVRNQILRKIGTFLDDSNLMYAFVLGTITGYQYKDDSDIDVQLIVDPPELAEHGPGTLVYKLQHGINGELVHNTKHPINFFLYRYMGKEPNWQDAAFGVYNLLSNRWEHDAGKAEDIRDPKLEYGIELNTAKMHLNKFEYLIGRWEADLIKLQNLHDDDAFVGRSRRIIKDELKRDFQELVEFCHDMDRERKLEYDLRWGIPRKNWRNVVFKVMEASPYKGYFEFFKDIKVDDYYTKLHDILKEATIDKEPIISYRAYDNYNSKLRLLPGIRYPEK